LLASQSCEIINEKEFSILSNGKAPADALKCIFVDQKEYAEEVPEGTSMIMTIPELKN
jgi:hypothetical protein